MREAGGRISDIPLGFEYPVTADLVRIQRRSVGLQRESGHVSSPDEVSETIRALNWSQRSQRNQR